MFVPLQPETEPSTGMEKENYTAPQLTSIAFRNEQGYSVSDPQSGLTNRLEMLFFEQDDQKKEVESFSEHNDWKSGVDNSFWQ